MTAQEYIAQAIAQSYDNRPEILAAEETELLLQLSLQFSGYYRMAAKENPGIFAARVAIAWATDGWDIPAAADTTIRIERTNGVEVVVVPLEDRTAEPSVGAVYRLGRRFYPAGNANDPSSINLLLFYALVAPAFALVTDEPGNEWPAQFDLMVVLELAAFLAGKDQREGDSGRLTREADEWKADFTRWAQTPDLPIRRRFGGPTVIPTPAVKPVGVNG